MKPAILVEEGTYGARAVLTREWSDSLLPILAAHRCVELELNYAKGWRGGDVEFLRRLQSLLGLKIIDYNIGSVAPIHCLGSLRTLELSTYCKSPIDFTKFPLLEDCGLEWRAGAQSVFEAKQLQSLFLSNYDGRECECIGRLTGLRSLTLLGAKVLSLGGLQHLLSLTELRLGGLRQVQTLHGIEALRRLEVLEVTECRKIDSIEEVSGLTQLRYFGLNDCGKIDSLEPLRQLELLEVVLFFGSTNIRDGNLSPLAALPLLKRVSFADRKHYSQRRASFQLA